MVSLCGMPGCENVAAVRVWSPRPVGDVPVELLCCAGHANDGRSQVRSAAGRGRVLVEALGVD